jgi:hypothetical protein
VATNVTSDLIVNLSGTSLTFYSDSSCTTVITNLTITTGTNSSIFYFIGSITGSLDLISQAIGYTNASQAETITTNPFIWIGGGANANWNTALNWSGGAMPGAGNLAVFDGTCIINCSPTINVGISVLGVRMAAGYAGTISQGLGNSITLGAAGWVQTEGIFSGGNSSITLNGPFILNGGSFTATSNTISIASVWAIRNSPTFNHKSGTLLLNYSLAMTPGTVHYNNIIIAGNAPTINLNNGLLNVDGNLTMSSITNPGTINSGSIMAYGNITNTNNGSKGSAILTVAGNPAGQTINGSNSPLINIIIAAGTNSVTLSGSIWPSGIFTMTSVGTFTTTGSTIGFAYNSSVIPGTVHYNNITFAGSAPTINLNNGLLNVDGTLTMSSITNPGTVNSGSIMAYGNITNTNNGSKGSAVITVAGNPAGQIITGSVNSILMNIIFAAGTNPVTISGSIWPGGIFTMTSVGTFTTTGSDLVLASTLSIMPGNVHYNNVKVAGNSPTINLNNGSLNIDGTLSFLSIGNSATINSGTIMAYADVSSTNFGANGSVDLQFVGSTNQTLTATSNLPTGNIKIAQTGGASLILASAVSWNSIGQTTTLTSGSINMAGNALTLKSLSLNSNIVTKTGGILTVNGAVAGTGSLFGGTINP